MRPCVMVMVRGSHGLSARRARRTKSRRPEGPQTKLLVCFINDHFEKLVTVILLSKVLSQAAIVETYIRSSTINSSTMAEHCGQISCKSSQSYKSLTLQNRQRVMIDL